jgi:hypothetical protein
MDRFLCPNAAFMSAFNAVTVLTQLAGRTSAAINFTFARCSEDRLGDCQHKSQGN